MPGQPALSSLEIQRFRCFESLRIERLGRVNLVVGKNNSGKTTLLEALRLYASPGMFSDTLDILANRDEIADRDPRYADYDVGDIEYGRLFHGRFATIGDSMIVGPTGAASQALKIFLVFVDEWLKDVDKSSVDVHRTELARINRTLGFLLDDHVQLLSNGRPILYKVHRPTPSGEESRAPLEPVLGTLRQIPVQWVGSNGLGQSDTEALWNDVSLSPLKEDVIAALRITTPEIEDIGLRTPEVHPRAIRDRREPHGLVPFARVQGAVVPVPLRSLGEGVNRFFSIALALAHTAGGLLLVDEIENGVHYSVQADLWRLIFRTAARLNVQVFATTHSYDCIRAFQEAARESDEDGMLIRLACKGDRTIVGEFDEPELEVAVAGEIEVR